MKRDGVSDRPAGILARDGPILALFLALTAVMTNPLVLHLANAVEDKQDALLNTWIIAWVGHALITDPLHLFDANIFYPYHNTLAFSEAQLPQGLFALPINLASGNTVLGYNLVLFFSFILAAYSMYLLAFDLTHQRAAAIVAGIIFAFNPYNLGNLAQVQLLSFGWLPLALMFLQRTINNSQLATDNWLRGNRDTFLFALFFSLQTLSSIYYGFLAGIAVVLYILWLLIRHHTSRPTPAGMPNAYHVSGFPITPDPSSQREEGRKKELGGAPPISPRLGADPPGPPRLLRNGLPTSPRGDDMHRPYNKIGGEGFYVSLFVRLSISAVIIAVLVVPVLLPYLEVQRELGFQRNLTESEQFSASLKLFTEVSAQNVIYGSFLSPRPPIMAGGYPQDNLFPGLVPLILAIIGLIAVKNRDRWFYLCLLLLAFVLSLGPRLFITPSLGTSIALPYRWLYDAIPFVHALRAPVRFDALVMLALAVLAGMGVQAVASGQWSVDSEQWVEGGRQRAEGGRQKAERTRQKAESVLVRLGFFVLIGLEYFAFPAANITPVPVGDAIPPYVHWLAQQPRGTVLELPMIGSDGVGAVDLTSQYLSTYHWQRTPDGYSGFIPPRRGEIAYDMKYLPYLGSPELLRALDVDYLVVHGNQIALLNTPGMPSPTSWREEVEDLPGITLVEQFGSDLIYRVTPLPQDKDALDAHLYLPQPAAPGQKYFAYLIAENRQERPFAIKPTDLLQIDALWDGPTQFKQRTTAILPLTTPEVSVVQVQLTAPPLAGTWHLELAVSSEATRRWVLTGDLSVENTEPAHEAVVPAYVISSELEPSYAPGDTIFVGIGWVPLNKIDGYYSASMRVVNEKGEKIAQDDHEPPTPTMLWWSPTSSLVRDEYFLTLPDHLEPGEYTVQLKMYQADQGIDALLVGPLPIPYGTVTIGRFTVK